jgi:hypothetical protein
MNQYWDQLLSETKRMVMRKTGKQIFFDKNTIDKIGESYSMIVRYRNRCYYVAHKVTDRWSLERNAWEFGQVIAKNIKNHRNVIC